MHVRYGRNRDSEPISAGFTAIKSCNRPRVINRAPPDHGPASRDAGSKPRSLLMAGEDDEMFMTRSLNITPKTSEQHLIARSDKSLTYYVTNNKRLCSTFCISLKLTNDRHRHGHTKHRAAYLRQQSYLLRHFASAVLINGPRMQVHVDCRDGEACVVRDG